MRSRGSIPGTGLRAVPLHSARLWARRALAVTTLESGNEAAFVNIVGTIELATIGKLSNMFGIPQLDDVKKNNGNHDEN